MAQENAEQNLNPTRVAPHSVEAEEAVLGAVLINPEVRLDVALHLGAEDFFIVRHRWIWQALERIHRRREAIDYLVLVAELEAMGCLDEVGGAAYVTYLVNNTPTSLHAETYARVVARAATRRRLLAAAGEVARLAHDEESEIEQVVEGAQAALLEAVEPHLARSLASVEALSSAYYDYVEYLYTHQDEARGLPTGLVDVDRYLLGGGLRPGKLYVVAGRPGMGKSAWLLTVARNAAKRGAGVVYFSLEMGAGDVEGYDPSVDGQSELLDRLYAMETGIDSEKLGRGELSAEEWEQLVLAMGEWDGQHAGRLKFDDTPAVTPFDVRAKCRRLAVAGELDLVVIDYLQLMHSGTPLDRENRIQAVGIVTRELKNLARELRVPILAAAQLNRNCEQRADKRPLLSDLRESGSIENDADMVAFLYRDEVYDPDTETPGVAEFIVGKNRAGKMGMAKLCFQAELTRFDNLARDAAASSWSSHGKDGKAKVAAPPMQLVVPPDTLQDLRANRQDELRFPKSKGERLEVHRSAPAVLDAEGNPLWRVGAQAAVKTDPAARSVGRARVRHIDEDEEAWVVTVRYTGDVA